MALGDGIDVAVQQQPTFTHDTLYPLSGINAIGTAYVFLSMRDSECFEHEWEMRISCLDQKGGFACGYHTSGEASGIIKGCGCDRKTGEQGEIHLQISGGAVRAAFSFWIRAQLYGI